MIIVEKKDKNNDTIYCVGDKEFSTYIKAKDYINRVLNLSKYKSVDDANIDSKLSDIVDIENTNIEGDLSDICPRTDDKTVQLES